VLSNQKAGHVPRPCGNLARISKMPYLESSLTDQPGRRVLPVSPVLHFGLNRQEPVFDPCVLVGIELQFIVAPAVSTGLLIPFIWIGLPIIVEFIGEYELPCLTGFILH
jgi:hypothetical protein